MHPLVGNGSADVFRASTANAYIHIGDGERKLAKGELVSFELFNNYEI